MLRPAPPARTTTWDRPPLSSGPCGGHGALPLERTLTWGERPALPVGAAAAAASLDRTTTWDRPPAAGFAVLDRTATWTAELRPAQDPSVPLGRTATLLESSRVSHAAHVYAPRVILLQPRTLSDQPSRLPPQAAVPWPSAVPPTALRPLPQSLHSQFAPLPATASVASVGVRPLTSVAPGTGVPSGATVGQPGQRAPMLAVRPLAPALRRTNTVTVSELPGAGAAAGAAAAVPSAPPRLAVVPDLRRALTVDHAGMALAAGKQQSVAATVPAAARAAVQGQPAPAPAVDGSRQQDAERCAAAGRSLLAAAFGQVSTKPAPAEPVGQLRLVVAGLMGSGKSTLCRALGHLIDGTWVNQDEFSHKGKGAKRAFLAEVEKVAKDKKTPALLVDKINTQVQHRREILDAFGAGVPGKVALLQLRHPRDAAGEWQQAIQLCKSRIEGRGEGHRTLKGDNPELGKILRMTANAAQAMTEEELSRFTARLELDMTLPPAELIAQTVASLSAEGLLRGRAEDIATDARIESALAVSKAAEESLEQAGAANGKSGADKGKKQQKQKGDSPVWLWEVQLDADSVERLQSLWNQWGVAVPDLKQVGDFHVTLLYLGGGSDEEAASRSPGLAAAGGAEAVARLREELARREGEETSFEVRRYVRDDRIACVQVGNLQLPCANLHPHVTLACGHRVPPVLSNELLARLAASEDMRTGLGPWLAQLGMAQYEAALLEWCGTMGAVSPEEIAENAADAAAAAENVDAERQRTLQQVLERAAHSSVYVEAFDPPLRLSGRISAKRRGR
eukprot:TRINITY_DN26269_c1_g3_i1.p1 TRINITY_DN26269_c1_g3~~TRINITY_DN26269_c1_g3_i1.p1  ORF type:complete len:809 (-),score=191.86 TRINITY_DN26269_c1_g3_i1:72-2450(-)